MKFFYDGGCLVSHWSINGEAADGIGPCDHIRGARPDFIDATAAFMKAQDKRHNEFQIHHNRSNFEKKTIFRCVYNTSGNFYWGVVQALQSNKNQIKESLKIDQRIPPDLYVSQRDLEELSQIGHVLQGPAKHID